MGEVGEEGKGRGTGHVGRERRGFKKLGEWLVKEKEGERKRREREKKKKAFLSGVSCAGQSKIWRTCTACSDLRSETGGM